MDAITSWNQVWNGNVKKNEGYAFRPSRINRALDKVGYFLQQGVSFNDGDKVLDAGCGDGAILLATLRNFKVEAHGVDFSAKALKEARSFMNQEKQSLELNLADARKTPYQDNSFDKVFSLGVIEHLHDSQNAVKELARLLKPGGVLILMTPNKYSWGRLDRIFKSFFGIWPFGYQTEFSPDELSFMAEQEGLIVTKKHVNPRRALPHDNLSFKLIHFIDQLINIFNKKWGFYSYIFVTKESKGKENKLC